MTEKDRKEVIRHEEALEVGTEVESYGSIRLRKRVETEHVEETVPLAVERAEIERIPAAEDDSGEIETLPDGSVSIPVIEEELVVTRRRVVRERVVVRKRVETEARLVEADLRKERVDVEATGDVRLEPDEGR
jgi:uncharacterized protein (TIGR02271 family)